MNQHLSTEQIAALAPGDYVIRTCGGEDTDIGIVVLYKDGSHNVSWIEIANFRFASRRWINALKDYNNYGTVRLRKSSESEYAMYTLAGACDHLS